MPESTKVGGREMDLSPEQVLALRNAKHMRSAMGFYPTDKGTAGDYFTDLNQRAVQWLKESKISGKNAREHFSEMSEFAESEAKWLNKNGVFADINSCYMLAYSTLTNAVGSYEAYLSRKRDRESK